MRISNGHEIIALEIHEFFVALGKLISFDAKAVLNAFILAINSDHWNRRIELIAKFKIDDFSYSVFDVALGN